MIEVRAILAVTIRVDSEGPMTDGEVIATLSLREQENREVSNGIADAFRFRADGVSFYAIGDDGRECYLHELLDVDVITWSAER